MEVKSEKQKVKVELKVFTKLGCETIGKEIEVSYDIFVAEDGARFLSENQCIKYEDKKNHRVRCPRCFGTGWIKTSKKRYLTPMESAIGYDNGYEEIQCNRCGGKGYLPERN